MKILYSCLSQSWGGMEMITVDAALQLINRGNEVSLLCYPGSKIHLSAKEKKIRTIPLKAGSYFHPTAIFGLVKLLKKEKFDLVHTQASKDLWTLVPALKLAAEKCPLFLTKQLGSFIEKKDVFHKFLYRRVTFAFAISRVIEKNLNDTTPLKKDKIKLLHNYVDTHKYDPSRTEGGKIRSEFNISDDDLVIGMLARFSKGKGHEEFLEAAKILCEKFDNIKFLIVGEASRGENEYAEKIKNLSENYGLMERVIFTGFRSDTPDVLSSLDVFAFPSHSEAFGIALVEAMACAKPSVCSNSDGVLDIAVDGETSYLFEKGNAEDLANKLELLITSKDKREAFGSAARKRAVEFFDVKILTDKVLKFYEEGINKNI